MTDQYCITNKNQLKSESPILKQKNINDFDKNNIPIFDPITRPKPHPDTNKPKIIIPKILD